MTELFMPEVKIPNDNEDETMGTTGDVIRVSEAENLVLWRFGFLEGSLFATAFKCFVEDFIFYLTDFDGNVIDTWRGWAADLPEKFRI